MVPVRVTAGAALASPFPAQTPVMSEDQPERRPRPLFDDPEPTQEPEPIPLYRRWVVWLGAVVVLGVAAAACVALTYAQPSPEEKAATRAAVTQFAGLFDQPAAR